MRFQQLLIGLFIAASIMPVSQAKSHVIASQYDPVQGTSLYRWCTQISFYKGLQIIIDNKNNRILYRQGEKAKFTPALLQLAHPHALVYNPFDNRYYLADTDNNRIVVFDSLISPRKITTTSIIAGTALVRPHDITVDPKSGWIYSLNPRSTIVFRFKGIGKEESRLDLSDQLGYARALSLIDGRLYVVGSAQGRILEITDFDKQIYTIHQSAGKIKIAAAGNWERTGLVLNDIEFFQGFWYATSYFCPKASLPGQDYNQNKLIRFKTWQDFEKGNWEDLSSQLPDTLVPYYLTVHDKTLYIPLYNHHTPGKGDCIYRLSSQKHWENILHPKHYPSENYQLVPVQK